MELAIKRTIIIEFLLLYLTFTCYMIISFSISASPSIPRGIHPLDEKYYASDVISCKDGSKAFTRDRLNDDFCDCPDGTDEPGTSACPTGKFYCRNLGSKPQFIYSSRVNDHICDCCDGSDEYDGRISCPNICVMGGNVEYKTVRHSSINKYPSSVLANESRKRIEFEDLFQKIKGLKLVIILQLILVVLMVLFCILRRHRKSKRSRFH